MGTNYYIKYPSCPTCGVGKPNLHVGKSSYGWCFALHVYPEDEDMPQNLENWKALFSENKILNEYGDEISSEEMLKIILDRSHPEQITDESVGERITGILSYKSKQDFLDKNSAELGPNNLLRHRPDKRFCLGPGPDNATYDLMIGKFS